MGTASAGLAVTPTPGRRLGLLVVGLALVMVPVLRWSEWLLRPRSAAAAAPSAALVVLVVPGAYFVVLSYRAFMAHELMVRFAKVVERPTTLPGVRIRPIWIRRRGRVVLGLDVGNSTSTFGWAELHRLNDRFDPTAPFGALAPVGIGRGVVLLAPDSRQLLVSCRPLRRIAPDRQVHPLAPVADRVLGWDRPAAPVAFLPTGPDGVIDLPADGALHLGTMPVPPADRTVHRLALACTARGRRASTGVLVAFAGSVGLVLLSPVGVAGAVIGAAVVGVWAAGLTGLTRWGLAPLVDHLVAEEALPPKQARTVAAMVLTAGQGRPAARQRPTAAG